MKQLPANYKDIPENLIEAIVKSNDTRKAHIVSEILKKNPKTVGIYRLTMKSGSELRSSAIFDIITKLQSEKVNIVIYEPMLNGNIYNGINVIKNIDEFKNTSDVILANRIDDILEDVNNKVYTRDLYKRD